MTQFGTERVAVSALLLLSLLVAALVTLGSQLTIRIVPDWRPLFLPGACFLVAIEAGLVRYRMLRGMHIVPGAFRYLAAELFSLAVLMRVVASLGLGASRFRDDAALWLRDPLSALDTPFILCLIAGLVTAVIVRNGLSTLAELRPPGADHSESRIDAELYRSSQENAGRSALARIGGNLAWGGAVVLLALVLQVVNVDPVGGPPLPLPPRSAVAGIVYTICGFLFYSQARLGLLQVRWSLDEATVDPQVLRIWGRTAAALVFILGFGALLLPSSYGLVALDTGRLGAAILFNLIALLAIIIGVISIGMISLLLTIPLLLLALFGTNNTLNTQPPVEFVPPPPPAPPPPETATNFTPGIIFWVAMGLLALYALWIVLRRQSWAIAIAARIRGGRIGQFVRRLLAFLPILRKQVRDFGTALGERLRRQPEPTRPPRRRLGRLSPAELIRYFYQSTVQRANQAGISRRRSDTPYEFGARLREQIPDADEDIAGVTDAYVRSVYGPQPTNPDDAKRARSPWERLRRKLRGRR
ncbi:MAG: DUF4129 domain-containing protein [Oscillochloris sp.]|nr:DUF4129 domain-containing protein [Oscillochloris sp.]